MSAAKNITILRKIREEIEGAQESVDYFWNPEIEVFESQPCAEELLASLDNINKLVAGVLGEKPVFVGFRETGG